MRHVPRAVIVGLLEWYRCRRFSMTVVDSAAGMIHERVARSEWRKPRVDFRADPRAGVKRQRPGFSVSDVSSGGGGSCVPLHADRRLLFLSSQSRLLS